MSEENQSDPKPYFERLVEDAERFIAHPFPPEKLRMQIPTEDPDNPSEAALETARRIRALGAKAEFIQKGMRTTFIGRPPIASDPRDKPKKKREEES